MIHLIKLNQGYRKGKVKKTILQSKIILILLRLKDYDLWS